MSSSKIWISRVIHKTLLDVNEAGTEAAAATIVVMAGSGRPSNVVTMVVDGRSSWPFKTIRLKPYFSWEWWLIRPRKGLQK